MDKMKTKKIGKIILNVLLYVFLAICIFAVFLTVFSKRDPDGATEVFGYQMRVVTSDSMGACEHTDVSDFEIKDIPIRSLIFVKVMPEDPEEADEWYRSLKVGDVLTFRYVYATQVTITHRITSITEKEDGGFLIELEGDNKNSENSDQLEQVIDTSIPHNPNYVIGKVTGQAYPLGLLMSFLMQPLGMVLVIIVPCFLIILLEILKIARVFSEDKKQKMQEENDKKESELEELRRKLADLEQEKAEQAQQTEQSDSAAEAVATITTTEEEGGEDQ